MEEVDWKLEVEMDEEFIELFYYIPGYHLRKDDGVMLLTNKEAFCLEALEEFTQACRQAETDYKAQKN